MGLHITVPPKGRVAINAAVIRNNGAQQADLFVENRAEVIREKNLMMPEEADTPVKRAYYAGQCVILTGIRPEPEQIEIFLGLLDDLTDVFRNAEAAAAVADARRLAGEREYYKAIMALKPAIAYEAVVLARDRAMALDAEGPGVPPGVEA